VTRPPLGGLLGAGRPALALPPPGRRYWHAQAFADALLEKFHTAEARRDRAGMREDFYILASYYRRTLSILHEALADRRERLAQAAMQNLIVLQGALSEMRRTSPNTSLSTLALETSLRQRVNQDLVYRILQDGRGPLGPTTILRRFNELDVIADVRAPAVAQALLTLVQTGHVIEHDGRYRASGVPYVDTNVDRSELAILFGDGLARRLADLGFEGVSSMLEQRDAFIESFAAETGLSRETASLAVACGEVLSQSAAAIHGARRWPHAELASSAHPRPYQRLLHAIFRAHRYAGQVIEAPAGSGKTLVGMLCIEDWLRSLAPGEAILVLVPTANYQRQWVGELCLNPIGLRLAPHLVFAGTPGGIGAVRRKGGSPTILVLTYVSLVRLGAGEGRGGFDGNAIEQFLQGNNVRHVILDEVHKVATSASSPAAEMTRVFMQWLRDRSLSGVIGFSGTVRTHERQLESLGLNIASVLGSRELIAQGWVAPFAEFGAPFTYSDRERGILSLIEKYRGLLRLYLDELDGARVRATFAAIPFAERVRIASLLRMYGSRREAAELIAERMKRWESGAAIHLSELLLVSIVQIAKGWSDARLAREMGIAQGSTRAELARVRAELRKELPPGRIQERLSVEGFGEALDATDATARNIRDALATTAVGGYLAMREWSRQAGEGRVAVVRAIIEAERRERAVSGVVIFDGSAPLRPVNGIASPGYRGAGGMFAELARDPTLVPIAALSSELYLPDDEVEPLHERIGRWILRRIVSEEQGTAMLALVATGAELDDQHATALKPEFARAFRRYVASLDDGGQAGVRGFDEQVLRPLREFVHKKDLAAGTRLLAWLSLDEHHLRAAVTSILDYAAIAKAFREARPVHLVRGDGSVGRVRVVSTGFGRRRQLLLDLTARLVDAEDLPIDVVVVTSWARTGWNVLTPNVLIDATATRDVTAWRQLRGRAMRPRPGWSMDAQRLVHRLISSGLPDAEEEGPLDLAELPRAEARILAAATGRRPSHITGRTPAECEALAAAVMLHQNKVTHIYELMSARGSSSQVELQRSTRRWVRSRAIGAKHNAEEAVRASDGELLAGPGHAPLIVADDPRRDSAKAFGQRLAEEIRGADPNIVEGWLRAALHPR
jgi:superfamily II DNA or RNA helicase